jgi:Tol biopolymer transport system component
MKLFFRVILFSLISFSSSFAQFTDFHPELNWYTIKGKHVEVHFHEGAERTARVVCKIADEVWGPITSLYDYEPGTVHFVIKDIDDYSNGATYFFDNKIEIWTSALDFDLRGAHNWLRNVISHEFTHMVQIQSAMKMTRSIPAVFLQVLNYEDKRRPDILYGYPNFIVSYPISSVNMPAWFAEGTAQYMRKEFNYDQWDTHRDMILREYALHGNMLTWNEMGEFGKTSLGNESVYNAGFALTRYISQKYGEKKLEEITRALGKVTNFTIDAAFKDVLGKDGNEIYNEWKDFLINDYKKRSEDVNENLVQGDIIAKEGFGNFYPVFSKDGKKCVYISNKSSDYFSPAGIYLHDFSSRNEEDKQLVDGVRSTIGWVGNQNKLIYAKLTDDNPNWYNTHDLYIYDINKDKETRITHGLRANQPSVSHDGNKIVFLFEKDGTTNLGIIDVDGKNFKRLTFFENGEQVYNPKFSNDDSFVVFDYSYTNGRDIAKVDTNASHYKNIIATPDDERNPVFASNGDLIYCSDQTGIFNIYRYNFKTSEKTQLTNVLGGAFMPDISEDGRILYAGYTSTGYKIFKITPDEQSKVESGKKYVWTDNPPLGSDKSKGDLANFNLEKLKNYNDYETPDYNKEKYSGAFSRLSFFPFIRLDNYNTSNSFLERLKPGVYVSSSDMLNRYSLFAGGSLNARLERDLFLIFEYRNKLPLLFDLGIKPELSLELYNISRKSGVDIFFGTDTLPNGEVHHDAVVNTDVTYNLFEVDLAAKHRIISRNQNIEFRFLWSRYTATLGSFIFPNTSILYPTTNDEYFIGRDLRFTYDFDLILPSRDMEINPVGAEVKFQYDYEFDKFNSDGEYTVEDGILKPKYNDYDFHKVELNSKLHFPLPFKSHTLTAQIRAGSILGPQIPDFFDFYLGGLVGMKAYPFYAISGNEIGWLDLTYRFPLFTQIDTRIGHIYLDKIFLAFYGDLGNAWNGNIPALNTFKKGAGAEIRIQMNSYYLFPTNLFFNAAYGFDKATRIVNETEITYGKEWRFYGGILFGFDI